MQIEIRLSSFYSLGDERRFFKALQGITAIKHVQGVGRGLLIDIDLRYLSEDALRDMIALFWRYGIVLVPLQVLATRKSFAWLSDERAYGTRACLGSLLRSERNLLRHCAEAAGGKASVVV